MSRAAPGPHPHPLTPADLPPGVAWWQTCRECHTPIQGGPAGLTVHQRTVHRPGRDGRIPITIRLDL